MGKLKVIYAAAAALAAFMSWAAFLPAAEKDTEARMSRMIEEQIKRRGITDQRVLDAMEKVERHRFVSPAMEDFAYEDRPLPIGHNQTISQPFIVAYMTSVAGVKPGHRVLEIGTGSGYQAAILAELAEQVYSVEIVEPLARQASERLKRLGYDNVKIKKGDGYKGWLEYAPFDVIIVTAAPPEVPEDLLGQLKVGGKMVIPVGTGFQELYLIKRTDEGFRKDRLMGVRFVPMVEGE